MQRQWTCRSSQIEILVMASQWKLRPERDFVPFFFMELKLPLLLNSSSRLIKRHFPIYPRGSRLLVTDFIPLKKVIFRLFRKVGIYQVRERFVYKTLSLSWSKMLYICIKHFTLKGVFKFIFFHYLHHISMQQSEITVPIL